MEYQQAPPEPRAPAKPRLVPTRIEPVRVEEKKFSPIAVPSPESVGVITPVKIPQPGEIGIDPK